MNAKLYFRASQFFGCITVACMLLTLLSSVELSFISILGDNNKAAQTSRPVKVAEESTNKKSRRKPSSNDKAPTARPVPLPGRPAPAPESPWTTFNLIMFVAALVSTACGIISMLLGWRADRRAMKQDATVNSRLNRNRARRSPHA